jgi:protein-S-isoprenylcysteine O-methyltransferase Ste14
MPPGFFMKRMENRKLNKSGIKVLIGTFLGPTMQATLLFILAGRMDIPGVWIYLVVGLVSVFGGMVLVGMVNPELLNHRGQWRKNKDTIPWDRFLIFLFGIMGFYILPAVIGLDIRFGWSYLGVHFTIAGVVLFLIGSVFFIWAMIVNTHFEVTVRIQKDRGHKVITTGPYKIVRHPGYVGAILWVVATPLIIGSIVGLIPTGIAVFALIIRTSLEDKTLHRELDGYAEYTGEVKHRLFPGIW